MTGAGPGERRELLVFAASSLQDALREAAAGFEAQAGLRLAFNFAGSNVLARQIRAAPRVADVFLSADSRWMDDLAGAGLIDGATRSALLSNVLAVVCRDDAPYTLSSPVDLADLPFRSLAVGDPESVPVGRYAKAALERIPRGPATLWEDLAGRIVPAADARATLALVESDPAVVGIVYRTDARSSGRVRVLIELDRRGPEIAYEGAVVSESRRSAEARAFLDFLRGPAARGIFERHGFVPAPISVTPAAPEAPRP